MFHEHCNECRYRECHRVETHAYYRQRRQGEDGSQQQRLCAPGDQTLYHAGEDIEHGGGAARGDTVVFGQIPGYLAGDDNSHRVVGGAQVGEAHHPGDAELGGFLVLFTIVLASETGNQGADALADPGQSTLTFHQGAEAADQHGEQEDLLHAGKALIDILAELTDGIAVDHAHHSGGQNTDPQYHKHIHSGERQPQDQQIRHHFE